MEAGRTLDAEVAKKVLKVLMCSKRFIKWTISGLLNAWDCPEHGLEGCVSDSAVPHYSTSITDAWQVVEHLTTAHKTFHLWCSPLNGEWHVDTDADDGSDRAIGIWAETAPLAICRAALAAVGAEVPA